MFWGCVLKENKPFEIKTGSNRIIHLSEACLNPNAGEGKVYLQLNSGNEKYNLCVLQKDKWESYKLDHFLSLFSDSTHPYKLSISGGGNSTEVHVTGYIETEEGEDDGLKVEKNEKPVEVLATKKQEEVNPKDEKSKAEQANPVERKNPKEHSVPKPSVETKKEEPKSQVPKKPVEDLEEDDEDSQLDDLDEEDKDEENEDESGDILDDDNSDDEEEMEMLLNKTKKEEAKPVKLQKLDDGSKKPTQTVNLNGNKNNQKPNTPNEKKPQNQQNNQQQNKLGQQGSANKQHPNQGSANKQHHNQGKPQQNQGSANKQNPNQGNKQHNGGKPHFGQQKNQQNQKN